MSAMPGTSDAATGGTRRTTRPGAGTVFYPPAIDVDAIAGRIERSLVKRVHYLVDTYPERATEIVRAWMAERG